jgi:hypothetical protein
MDSSANKLDALLLSPGRGVGRFSNPTSVKLLVLVLILALVRVFVLSGQKPLSEDEIAAMKWRIAKEIPVGSRPCVWDGLSATEFHSGVTYGEAMDVFGSLVVRCKAGG